MNMNTYVLCGVVLRTEYESDYICFLILEGEKDSRKKKMRY